MNWGHVSKWFGRKGYRLLTIKCSFMENKAAWHGKAPNEEELNQALKELGEE